MTLNRLRHRLGIAATAALMGWTTLTAAPAPAHAETVDGRGKGIAGGIMLGAELVMSVEALFGVKPAWAYILGGGLGAVGGGLAGFGVESAAGCYTTTGYGGSSSGDGRAPVTMLALGLAFVIPTIVLVANATRFKPSEDAVEDKAPRNSPPADPGKVGGSVVVGGEGGGTGPAAPTSPAAPAGGAGGVGGAGGAGGTGGGTGPAPTPQQAPPPTSLMDVHTGTLRLGLPAPEVRNAYTLQQQKDLGVQQITEVRFPVLRVSF